MFIRLSIDFEHSSKTWWESGGQALWDSLIEEFDAHRVVVEESIARSWLEQAAQLPGWGDGPEFAPHPVTYAPVADDDEDI